MAARPDPRPCGTYSRLCLDLANTVEPRQGHPQRDHLRGYADLVRWARHAGALDDAQAQRLLAAAATHPAAAQTSFATAIALHEAIYRALATIAQGATPAAADLDRMQRAWARRCATPASARPLAASPGAADRPPACRPRPRPVTARPNPIVRGRTHHAIAACRRCRLAPKPITARSGAMRLTASLAPSARVSRRGEAKLAGPIQTTPQGAATQISSRDSSRSSSRRIRFITSFESLPSRRIRNSAVRCAPKTSCTICW